MTTVKIATAQLRALTDPVKASELHKFHKVDRQYLGLANPVIDELVKAWREEVDLEGRLALAHGLWKGNIHEGRIAAAKLLTQARIRPDDQAAWELIKSWVPTFDAGTIADHASTAGQKRLVADPSRLDEVELWTTSEHMWSRRAALVMTLPWTKKNHPKLDEIAVRERVLGWAASYVTDHDKVIQRAVAGWLRDLSKHDPVRVRAFLDIHADAMKPSAAKEAARMLPA